MKFLILFSILFSVAANANQNILAEVYVSRHAKPSVEVEAQRTLTIDAKKKCSTENVMQVSQAMYEPVEGSSNWYGVGTWTVGYNAKAIFECLL